MLYRDPYGLVDCGSVIFAAVVDPPMDEPLDKWMISLVLTGTQPQTTFILYPTQMERDMAFANLGTMVEAAFIAMQKEVKDEK